MPHVWVAAFGYRSDENGIRYSAVQPVAVIRAAVS
jgi:hypothetical protein